ncbi:MAG: HD-GYP domain-containing protein, partial [Lachnospiraceae bacterium]|nr:HD-GYP domain-containing protein [Lachnospiraceae bacterium]
MGTREYISTKRLQPGMIIDQSITDATGRVMIKRNVYLDQYQIEYLMSRGISGVYITDTLEEDGKPGIEPIKKKIIIPSAAKKVIARERVDDPTKVEMSETVKARVNEGIQYLFKNTNADNFSGAAMQVSKDLTEAIMTNSAVAIDINTLKVSDEYTFKH